MSTFDDILPMSAIADNQKCQQSLTFLRPKASGRAGRGHALRRGSQYTSEPFQRLMAEHGISCSMSRSGNVWDNAAMESIFSSLKIERTSAKTYRTRNQAKADVFDYIECFYNPRRRHSTLGYLSPIDFEKKAIQA